jgi:acetyltransferase-like isoleucine patch superfamily enzyme
MAWCLLWNNSISGGVVSCSSSSRCSRWTSACFRLGRGVYINSLAVNDHNLLELGNRVVIGDGVHLSGHTVEHGVVRTARVHLGDDVTIGLGTVVPIGVEAGARSQVGALSFVPKFSRLEADTTYVGAPVRPLQRNEERQLDLVSPLAVSEAL